MKRSCQASAQQRDLSKASAKQESYSSASDSELKDASLSDDKIMIVEGELNDFELMLNSVESPNKITTSSRPTTYRGYSDWTKCCRDSKIDLASQVTGQTLFCVLGLENPRGTPPQSLVRPHKKVDISKGALLKSLDTICDVFDALETHTKQMKFKERPALVLRSHTILFVYLLFVTI